MGVFFSCPSPLQTFTKFWSLKPIVPSWSDTDKIYSNSQKGWLHTFAFSGHRPVKPLSSHPRFVSTSGYKVSSEMQAFLWISGTALRSSRQFGGCHFILIIHGPCFFIRAAMATLLLWRYNTSSWSHALQVFLWRFPLERKTFTWCMCSYPMVMSGCNTNGLLRTASYLAKALSIAICSLCKSQANFFLLSQLRNAQFKHKKRHQILLHGS